MKTLGEMGKDIKRLEIITERFSKIGSKPELHPQDLEQVLEESIGYMRPRTSRKISIELKNLLTEEERMIVRLNVPLFDWVIENLFQYAYIDVIDTGKGIPKSKLETIFQPGYTSKRRGWGLGLSLAKRIIEEYHKGKIFVKHSEIGKGTTFRILIPKA